MVLNFNDFTGGIVPAFDASKPIQDTYPMLINGRVRKNVVSAVKQALKESDQPVGLAQGIYGMDYYLIAFIDGRAWYKDTRNVSNGWVMIADIALSNIAPAIHMVKVPSSTLNFKRQSQYSTASVGYTNVPISTSQAGSLCMDGITQDVIIYPTSSGLAGRTTQTYEQWRLTQYSGDSVTYGDAQEYVPLGMYPIWTGQKLFKVGTDEHGRFTKILQSVSGRPLDFCVEIDSTGNKAGKADRVSHAVAYEELTSLFVVPAQDTSFIACTATRAFGVFGDPSITIFGEFFLRTIPLFDAGSAGHFSSVDVNGELTFVGRNSIHAVNAVVADKASSLQKYVSRNRTFSTPIDQLMAANTHGAAVRHDDYALYAVNTVIGPAVVVYDINTDKFVSVDKWKGVGAVKQFATTYWDGVEQLWCLDDAGQIFKVYASAAYETARIYLGDVNSQDAFTGHQITNIAAMFSNVHADFDVSVDVYKDRLLTDSLIRTVTGQAAYLESIIPFDEVRTKTIEGFQIGTDDARTAFASGVLISWSSDAQLTHVSLDVDKVDNASTLDGPVPSVTKVAFVANTSLEETYSVTDSCGSTQTGVVFPKIISNINAFDPVITIGAGDHLEEGSLANYNTMKPYFTRLGEFLAAPGNQDQDTDVGLVFNNYLGGGSTNKRKLISPLVEVFMLNSGYSTSGSLPVNLPPDSEPLGNDENSLQAIWLKAALATSTAKFKIIVMHHDPYSDDSLYTPGYAKLRWPFRTWGANMIISGHARSYQRMIIDDLQYVVVGTGGATLRELNPSHLYDDKTMYATDSQFGHGELIARSHSVTWQFVAVDGTILDKTTIRL